jgi:hypothetical protein
MGGNGQRYLEALRKYMVEEAGRKFFVDEIGMDEDYYIEESWTLINAYASKTMIANINDIMDKYIIVT